MRDDIPSKFIPMKNSTTEGFFIELNTRKKKWVLCCTYNPNCIFISDHLRTIGNNIDLLLANYENFFSTLRAIMVFLKSFVISTISKI